MRKISPLLFLLALGLSACISPAPPRAKGYYGPTLPLEDVIAKINENNTKITSLWSRNHFAANLVDREHNKAVRVDGYGNLMYAAPNQLRLTAKNEVENLFELGSDGTHFWLYEMHDAVFWWGDYEDIGGLDSAEIPVRPDMIMEILGIRPVNPFLTQPPVPTMRFHNFADAYMIDWMTPSNGHWSVIKEIWYDRATLLPKRVVIFDAQGRVALWAMLKNPAPIEVQGLDKAQWPMMATRFDLSFPYSGTTMTFELTDMTLSHNGKPDEKSFRMPDPDELASHGVKVNRIGKTQIKTGNYGGGFQQENNSQQENSHQEGGSH